MYKVITSKQYKKSLKAVLKTGRVKIFEIDAVIDTLRKDKILEIKHKDHALVGEYLGYRECHIKPNILLVYRKEKDVLFLYLQDIGSHSNLFK